MQNTGKEQGTSEDGDSGICGEDEGQRVESKFPQIICFKCGESGHYSSACSKPKVCFICYRKDHVVENCLEWKNPQGDCPVLWEC